MDLQLATTLTTQYINLYASAKLEESKAQKLRDFFSQVQAIIQAAMPPPMPPPGAPGAAPQGPGGAPPTAAPEPQQTSPLVNNNPNMQPQ